MPDIHRVLLLAVAGQLMEPGLRQLVELIKIRRVRDVLQPPVVLPVGPNEIAFRVQRFRELAVLEGKFHWFARLSEIIHPKGEDILGKWQEVSSGGSAASLQPSSYMNWSTRRAGSWI